MKESHIIARISLVAAVVMCTSRTVSADCKITDTDDKFEIVCTGGESAHKKTGKNVSQKNAVAEKQSLQARSVIKMNDEEVTFMETRNRQDGYRPSRKAHKKASEAPHS